ncbi:MAG: hypothetical protein SGI92_27860, partial [Bryobacteraceae bacterium]|nr:hypothetical protein [Bryobacteraceae bacterium]
MKARDLDELVEYSLPFDPARGPMPIRNRIDQFASCGHAQLSLDSVSRHVDFRRVTFSLGNGRSSRWCGFPAPEQLKPFPAPPNEGIGFDDAQSIN